MPQIYFGTRGGGESCLGDPLRGWGHKKKFGGGGWLGLLEGPPKLHGRPPPCGGSAQQYPSAFRSFGALPSASSYPMGPGHAPVREGGLI